MADVLENVYQITRYLIVNNHIGARTTNQGTVREALNIPQEEFRSALAFLGGHSYCLTTGGGDKGLIVLKPLGVSYYEQVSRERIPLSLDAELLLKFLITDQSPDFPFSIADHISDSLGWDEERYMRAAQELGDEGFVTGDYAGGNPFFKITLLSEGRKAVKRNFRVASPSVVMHDGDNIIIENTGASAVIAAGRNSSANQGLNGPEVADLFETVFRKIDQRSDLPAPLKGEIRETVELIQSEVEKGDNANEKLLSHLFRSLQKMAPDILEVAIVAATNPLLAATVVVKKVADKIKAEAN
jgi:hypothetical protein